MNKKNLIQIVVICACFAASGIVIYNNFFKKPTLPDELAAGSGIVSPGTVDVPILPNGSLFDLKPIQNSHFHYNLIEYPKLSYPDEVGLDVEGILKPVNLNTDTFSQTTNKK